MLLTGSQVKYMRYSPQITYKYGKGCIDAIYGLMGWKGLKTEEQLDQLAMG